MTHPHIRMTRLELMDRLVLTGFAGFVIGVVVMAGLFAVFNK